MLLGLQRCCLSCLSRCPKQDLGGATKKKGEDGKEKVEVNIPTAPEDGEPQLDRLGFHTDISLPPKVDALWLHMRKEISTPFVAVHEKRNIDAKQADHFANIRSVERAIDSLGSGR